MVVKLNTFYLLFIIALFLGSCKDDVVEQPTPVSDYLKITLQPVYGSANLSLDDTITTVEGYKVQFTDLKCYFSDVKNGGNTLSQSGLFDFKQTGTFLLQEIGKKADYSSLNAYLGVDPVINHNDPYAFPNSSPLNIANENDMNLDWNLGYIFLKLDMAKFLQNGAQTIDLKTEHTTHSAAGQETLSLKVIQNFKDAISTY